MLETLEATIDTFGNVKLSEKKRLSTTHRALVTIMDEVKTGASDFELVGSVEIIGDLESGSAEISEMFRQSIKRSADELTR